MEKLNCDEIDHRHRDLVEKSFQVLGCIFRTQFGLPVPEDSQLNPEEFVIFGRRDRTLRVYVRRITKHDYNVGMVRSMFNRRGKSMHDPEKFFQNVFYNGSAEILTFTITRSVIEGEMIYILQKQEQFPMIQVVRNTYGDAVQPGWGDFSDNVFYIHTR